jgi:large subunit ribosomal protein L25
MYGHGADPIHITLPGHDTMMALKQANVLLSIELDGTSQLALAKDIQRDPVRPVIEHVDLVIVRRGEKVQVEVPVITEGQASSDAIVTVESQTLLLEVEATAIPEYVVVNIDGAQAGTQIHVSDITLPDGAQLVDDDDILVVNIAAQAAEETADETASASEGGAADSGVES